jgi:hypothetical protein
VNRGRAALARWWAAFILLWCAGAFIVAFPLNHLACSAENTAPEPESSQGAYCESVDDYLGWGEPSELTTPLPYLLPVAILAVLGGYGIWRRSKRFLRIAAAGAVAAIVAHFVVILLLPG